MVMLWAQLTHRDSLRDIEAGLRAHGEKLYRLGMGKSVNKSTMSYANTNGGRGVQGTRPKDDGTCVKSGRG